MDRTVAIIQARMNSNRLANKMMLYFHGYPIVAWIQIRLSKSKLLDDIVFAIPNTEADDLLFDYLISINANVMRGSEKDVVKRYMKVAKKLKAKSVVRVCADNPLICASEIDRLIEFYCNAGADYAYNHMPLANSWPDGLGAEISSIDILEKINEKAKLQSQREHVFNYVWDNPNDFSIKTFAPPSYLAYPKLKLDIDTYKDYRRLMSLPFRPDMSAKQVVNIALKRNSDKD
jgi:spore coat polysaccharide biosynthesis protein SpsF